MASIPIPKLSSPLFSGFDEYYVREMLPELKSYEPKRKKVALECRIIIAVTIIVLVLITAAAAKDYLSYGGAFAIAFVVFVVLIFLLNWRMSKDYANISDILVGGIAAFLQLNHHSDKRRPRRLGTFQKYGLVPNYNEMECGNIVEGELNGIRFSISETVLSKAYSEKKSSRTVFSGQLFCIERSRTIKEPIVLIKRGLRLNAFRRPFAGAERVKIDTDRASRKFRIWSTAPDLAKHVLMENTPVIESLNRLYPKSRMRIGFIKNRIYVSVQNGIRLKPGSIFKPLDHPNRTQHLIEVFDDIIATAMVARA